MFLWQALEPKNIVTEILAMKSAIKNDHQPSLRSAGVSGAIRVKVLAKLANIVNSGKADI